MSSSTWYKIIKDYLRWYSNALGSVINSYEENVKQYGNCSEYEKACLFILQKYQDNFGGNIPFHHHFVNLLDEGLLKIINNKWSYPSSKKKITMLTLI
jgi:hypothetical protein